MTPHEPASQNEAESRGPSRARSLAPTSVMAEGRRESRPLPGAQREASVWGRSVQRLRGAGVALAILLFWSTGLLLAWLVAPAVYLSARDPLRRRRRMQHIVARAFRWFLGLLDVTTLYRHAYRGDLQVLRAPVVAVANHPSLLDVTVIIARMPEACCLVKNSLIRNPLVGHLLRMCGHVAAGDGSLMGGMAVLQAMQQRLRDGFPVLVFPEGTRSPSGGMHTFRRGAFEIARRAGVPVVPLWLRCDPPALGKGTPVWRHPRRCPTLTVHVGPHVDTYGADAKELCKSVERDFCTRLGVSRAPGEQGT